MKRCVLLSLCCCMLFTCSKKNSNIAVCNNIPFNEMLCEYFLQYIAKDSMINILRLDDTYFRHENQYHIQKDSLYNFAINYFTTSEWISKWAITYNNAYLLWLVSSKNTDTCYYSYDRFLLCDSCGTILDSLRIMTSAGCVESVVDGEDVFSYEDFSDFYVDKRNLIWLYYKSSYSKDSMTCIKTAYKITETNIKQCNVQEYKLTYQDYSKGWQGWK